MHAFVIFFYFKEFRGWTRGDSDSSLIRDEVAIPGKGRIEQPRYRPHTQELVPYLFSKYLALIPVVPALINFDNLDFYANIGQAGLALLSRCMSHDMRHVTWAGSLVNHHVTYVWGIITETI